MESRNTRGSEWRKWDLHIHSNASDGKSTPEDIIAEAKSKGLAVIALTDHHTTKNIDTIKSIGVREGISVISGIEFRSEYGQKSVHFIGLFPDSFNNIQLNSNALHDLILSPLGVSETLIIAKGRESNSAFDDSASFKAGMFLVQVDLKKASDLIHKYGGLVSVHNGSKENGLDTEVKHQGSGVRNVNDLSESLGTLKEELLDGGYIDICEIRKENDNAEFYLRQFDKPSIIASDAHDTNSIGNKFVWIKADTSFEGLKQIIFEPEDRVRIQDEIPEPKNDYQIIESITLAHKHFGSQNIPFNPNLNTIIGGRSAGKSILLGCIAKKIGTKRKVKDRNIAYEEYIDSLLPSVTVNWQDGISTSTRDIEYFPQSFINNLAANSEDVNKLIENTIKNNASRKTQIENYYSFCIDNKSKINLEIAGYFNTSEKVKEKQLEIASQGNKDGIVKQIEKDKMELQEIKNHMGTAISEEEEQCYRHFVENIGKLQVKIANSQKHIIRIEELMETNIFYDISNDLIGISEDIREEIQNRYSELRHDTMLKWKSILQGLINREKSQILNNQSEIDRNKGNDIYIKCNEYFNQNQSYTEKEKRLRIEEEKLKVINDLEREIVEFKEKVISKAESILDLHYEYFNNAQNLSRAIEFENSEVKISAAPKFNQKKFYENLAIRFDQRSPDTRNTIEYIHERNDLYSSFIKDVFNKVLSGQIQLKSSYNPQQVLIDILAENYYDIAYDVSYEDDNLSSMSEGKKAFIILRILLDFNDKECPILIDQPEDDLDNRAIYDQLVAYVKKKKKERQIIIVTHNPNIVVGADAEEVLVANQNGINTKNQDGIKFEYLTGSLEDTREKDDSLPLLIGKGIKQHVCEILEGGDVAFKKREQKYGIKTLI